MKVPDADAAIDIILDYPAGDSATKRLDKEGPFALPDPSGMSGGGLWDQGFETQLIWKPEGASLMGIQSAWHPKERYVRAVQIIHWLRLVHQHYPDLRNILEERFPELH